MRFALSIALKYLIPRRRQLSVSIISLVSVLVISLVVWLAVVFLSVTVGIEKKWLDEFTTLSAPLKIKPTEKYYNSYYYLVDSIAQKSNYTLKTLGEKLKDQGDPYDSTADIEPPKSFPQPLLNEDGSFKDLAKEARDAAMAASSHHPGFRLGEFEAGFGNLHLNLIRDSTDTILTQVSYIIGFDKENRRFQKLLMAPRAEDLKHLENMLSNNHEHHGIETYMATPQHIPASADLGEGILLPKSFQKNTVLVGDRGYISYYTTTASGMQEQRLPVYVSGFYDPGMMPLGNKMIFSDPKIPSMIKSNIVVSDDFFGNGFSLWLDDISLVEKVKEEIKLNLEKKGLSSYFTVESFSDYDFSRPLLEQLKSDKNLFTLIAIIILLVACSNVVSMLLLLVNDKKKEIAVLQAIGATPFTVVSIFGLAGMITGVVSCLLGTVAAFFTLQNLNVLVNALSFIQGREAFQAAFFGSTLPNAISWESLIFIISTTCIVSLIAGIIPALKVVKLRPSETLRSE